MASFTGRSTSEEGSTDSIAACVRCVSVAARVSCVVAAARSGGGSPSNTSAMALPFLSSNSTEAEEKRDNRPEKEEMRKFEN
jgi:hypothetical protein